MKPKPRGPRLTIIGAFSVLIRGLKSLEETKERKIIIISYNFTCLTKYLCTYEIEIETSVSPKSLPAGWSIPGRSGTRSSRALNGWLIGPVRVSGIVSTASTILRWNHQTQSCRWRWLHDRRSVGQKKTESKGEARLNDYTNVPEAAHQTLLQRRRQNDDGFTLSW